MNTLWLTSRSAFERGTAYCAWARYVENHAGPFGYGFSRKAQSLPLVTGSYAHYGLALVLQWVLDGRKKTGVQVEEAPDEVIRWAVEESVEKYTKVCDKRGILTYAQDDPESLARLQTLIKEQTYLIEGLIWAWCLGRLPAILAEYLIIEVEGEQEYVLDCTCGIGTGVGGFAAHAERGCGGIGLQSRPDFLGERHSDSKLGYIEFKTSSVSKKSWADSFERKQQLLIGTLGAERRYGVAVTHAQIEGLVKGQRKRDYPYAAEQIKLQQSPLCYAYFSPGNPPIAEASWRPQYEYFDREGMKFTAGKKEGYRKTALWFQDTEGQEIDPWPGKPAEMSVVEYWVKVMIADYPLHIAKIVSPIGPIPRQDQQIPKAMRSFVAEERLWQDRLWRIYEYSQSTGKEWGDDDFMAFLETVVPRSWNCDPYGPDHPCPNQPICHPVTDDWRDPVGSGLFVYRVPHHKAELEQLKERGLVPEEGFAEEVDEGDEIGD